ncbi:MAG: FAD-binding oxidoreductase [Chloroflexi bacterium]|nr:FAD-binding oxidoreductase [Chloroflexota bacterium]
MALTEPRRPRIASADLDRASWLEHRLGRLLGADLRADAATRALYSSDASNYRVVPRLVASPRSVEQLAEVVGHAAEARIPVTMRGAGTSVAGNAIGPGLVIDTSRHLTAIHSIDPEAMTATVEPGVVLDELNAALAGRGLRVGPDPSTHDRCTVGGMVGNDACGSHSIAWGTTAANTVGLHVIRSDGSRVSVGSNGAGGGALPGRLGDDLRSLVAEGVDLIRRELPYWPRRVSGYGLDRLLPERGFDVAGALVGTEGTCAIVAAVTLRLVPAPAARCLLVLGYPDDIAAASAAVALLPAGPATVEGMTSEIVRLARDRRAVELLPHGDAWLFVEATGASAAAARAHGETLASAVGLARDDARARMHEDRAAMAALWRIREDGAGRATRLADGSPAWPGLEDATVPPERLAAYLADFHRLLAAHDLRGTTYGHFGEGCVHVRIGFDFAPPSGVARFDAFMSDAADLIVAHGGSLSGEHGDGRARSALLGRMFSPGLLDLFARYKAAWDPVGILNPGVVVDPAPLDRDLRPAVPTRVDARPVHALAADRGDLRTAVSRCVGVGKCVSKTSDALMCPSFRATGDEMDSTRGRARVLQEMLAGSLSTDGWRSRDVLRALDLCLSCRGCASDCPTAVDMARYRSEFLHHHYAGRIRPRAHYSLGRLPTWLRLTRRIPRLVNLVTHGPVVSRLFALAAGVAPDRTIPLLPRRTLVRSLDARTRGTGGVAASATRGAAATRGSGPPASAARGRIVLWPDTFTNHLAPAAGLAAIDVLEAAGFEVVVPRTPVCCGLTWMTTGQLDAARRVGSRSLGAPELAGDEPVVVLEPSCATTLRVDLPDLLPDDARAGRLAARVRTLAEILDGVDLPLSAGPPLRAVVQPHCHQQAVLGMEADGRLLARAGIDVVEMVRGCCGLAGDFGAVRGHAEVSRAVAEQHLVPALVRADDGTLVIADGFSCRTQVSFVSDRRARHLAEVLASRLRDSDA